MRHFRPGLLQQFFARVTEDPAVLVVHGQDAPVPAGAGKTHGGEVKITAKTLLTFPQGLLRVDAVGDVVEHGHEAGLAADIDGFGAQGDNPEFPGARPGAHLEVVHRPGRFQLAHHDLTIPGILPNAEFHGGMAQHLFAGVAVEPAVSLVHFDVPARLQFRDAQTIRAGAKGLGEFLF